MYKLEMKELNADDPLVDCRSWLDIWVVKHALDVASVDFNTEVFDTNDIKPVGLKGTLKTINLNFSLRIA